MYKYFGWSRREKKPTEFPLITRVDIFPSVSIWIKVIDFIKIYIFFKTKGHTATHNREKKSWN